MGHRPWGHQGRSRAGRTAPSTTHAPLNIPQDIVPSSFLSRMVVLCTIFFFLCCIPYQVGKLVEAISSKSAYRTAAFRPVRNTEHAVLLGTITYPVLASFVEQFLHGNERLEHNFRLVILSPTEPDPW